MFDREWWDELDDDPNAPLTVDPKDLPTADELVVEERLWGRCVHRGAREVVKERKITAPKGVTVFRRAVFIVCDRCQGEMYYREKDDPRPTSPPELVMMASVPKHARQELAAQTLSRSLRSAGWDMVMRRVDGLYRCRASKGKLVVESESLPSEGEAVCRVIADIARAGHSFEPEG